MESRPQIHHGWNVSAAQARSIQERLRSEVIRADQITEVRKVAGIDVGFEENNRITRAAVVILEFPGLKLLEYRLVRTPTRFPYIPGLLSFREAPAVLKAMEALRQIPDLIFCDGQGIAHPRRFGIACHLGVLTGIPAIGVAKSRLVGDYLPLAANKGSRQALTLGDEVIGTVLRTRTKVKHLFISVGHKVSLATAEEYVMHCITRFRLPETTRWAHRIASDKSGREDWLEYIDHR